MSGLSRPLSGALLFCLLTALQAVPPLAAQAPSQDGGTYARRGLTIGAITGGTVGALGFFLLGLGLCESSSCDTDAFELGMLGAVTGAAGGALTGLVIGAAIPRRGGEATDSAPGDSVPDATGREQLPRPVSRWSAVVSLGPSIGTGEHLPGPGLWASFALLRPTASRVRWGVEVSHLGRRSSDDVYTGSIGSDPPTTFRSSRTQTVWNASLISVRSAGDGPSQGRYLLASVGVYPQREVVRNRQTPTAPGGNWTWADTTPLPGLSLGGGGAWTVAPAAVLGLESRLHLLLGAGDWVTGLLTVGGTLRFQR